MAGKKGYHHGDLRTALLVAAEEELIESGVAHFSLRSCARRAGVSHAAPLHHFRTVEGLLAELAGIGFERLCASMDTEIESAGANLRDRALGSGIGYVAFATANPALFGLMFSAISKQAPSQLRDEAGMRAYGILEGVVDAVIESEKSAVDRATAIGTAWSGVHGLSHLLIEELGPFLRGLEGEARDAAIRQVIARTLP